MIKHNHTEAFRLMQYACEDCEHNEIIWNSRDGVTPFGMNCPACNSINMLHVNWRQDVYAPDHVPEPGQGVWIDMPESLKRPVALQRMKRAEGSSFEVRGEERKALIEYIIEDIGPGTPWLIRWR